MAIFELLAARPAFASSSHEFGELGNFRGMGVGQWSHGVFDHRQQVIDRFNCACARAIEAIRNSAPRSTPQRKPVIGCQQPRASEISDRSGCRFSGTVRRDAFGDQSLGNHVISDRCKVDAYTSARNCDEIIRNIVGENHEHRSGGRFFNGL